MFPKEKSTVFLLAVIAGLAGFCAWQESQIADLQERMMHVEAAKYGEQLSGVYWRFSTMDEKFTEIGKDIHHLEKQSTEHEWRIMNLEWEKE